MPQIRPITDLRNTNEISDICHARKEPVFITKNGYGDLVIMSIETYEDMLEEREFDTAIAEAKPSMRTASFDAREDAFAWIKPKLLSCAYRDLTASSRRTDQSYGTEAHDA